MKDLKIFNNEEFGQIRTIVDEKNEAWFVGKDIAEILGYKQTANMVKILDDRDYKEINPQNVENAGFIQNGITLEPNKNIKRMLVINESALYQAIFGSTLDKAKEFKRWVTSEVLPAIRRDGGYISVNKGDTEDDILARAMIIANKRIESLKLESKKKDQIIGEQKPKVLFANTVATSKDSVLVGGLAKILKQNGVDIGANRLFEWLRQEGFLCKSKGENWNAPTQRSMEQGLFEVKVRTINNPDGSTKITRTPKVTGKGQIYFVNKFLG